MGEAGGGEVVFGDSGAVAFGEVGQEVGRGHFARGADDEQQVAGLGQFLGFFLDLKRNGFAEEDHIRFNEATAGAIEGDFREIQALPEKGTGAFQAHEAVGVAVVFHHPLGPRGLVEVVHVLGDDPEQQAPGLQFCQGQVRGVGPGSGNGLVQFPDQAPDLGRVGAKGPDMGVFHGVEALPEAARAPEVGDAGLHGNAGAGQSHGPVTLAD